MFDEYDCGCIVSPRQGRVRICVGHRNVVECVGNTLVIRKTFPSGEVVRSYPANGESPMVR